MRILVSMKLCCCLLYLLLRVHLSSLLLGMLIGSLDLSLLFFLRMFLSVALACVCLSLSSQPYAYPSRFLRRHCFAASLFRCFAASLFRCLAVSPLCRFADCSFVADSCCPLFCSMGIFVSSAVDRFCGLFSKHLRPFVK